MTTAHAHSLWHAWRRTADEDAFRDLVTGELAYAADLARRMGASTSEADDAVQEALVKLAREPSDTPVRIGIRAWLCRRVALAFKMHVRASGRRRRHERAAAKPDRGIGPSAAVELRESVNDALAALKPDLHQAVVLRHLHDLDYTQMAHVLGISRNACRLRVFRGLRALRDVLGPDAATMVAIIGVPVFAPAVAPATLAGAAGAAGGGGATALGVKMVVGAAAATALTTAAVWIGRDNTLEPPPPSRIAPVVAAVPVAPEPPAPPAAAAPAPLSRPTVAPALALLDAHLAGDRDASEVLWDFDALDALLGAAEGKTVRVRDAARPLDLADVAAGATRVELAPGRHALERGLHIEDPHGVLEIVGAGVDRTTLVLDRATAIRVDGSLAGLRMRDLTIEGGTLLDVRGRGAANFERVRFQAWQDRAGYGAPVGTTGAALLGFRDCAFVGGVRRRAAGRALAVRGAALILLDGCVLSDVESAVANGHPGRTHARSLAQLRNCTLEGTRLVRRDDRAEDGYPMRVRGGRVRYGLARQGVESRWKAFGRERVEIGPAVVLEPEPPRVSMAQLRAFLQSVPAPDGERLLAVEVLVHRGAAGPRFVTHHGLPAGPNRVRLWRMLQGRAALAGEPPPETLRPLPWSPGEGGSLAELLEARWAQLDPLEAAGGAALHCRTDGSPVLVLFDRFLQQRR